MNDVYDCGVDRALCNECLERIPFGIQVRDGKVFLEKICPAHGKQETMLSHDENYFSYTYAYPFIANGFVADTEVIRGCPDDCGLCNAHDQAPYAVIIEALDECNMLCPTCIAASRPGAGKVRPCRQILERVKNYAVRQGKLDLVMVSGGEPTIHPEILEILSGTKQHARHVMLITNGRRISEDDKFVRELAEIGERLEIYLQFDSLREHVLQELRGSDLREVRSKALAKLEKYNIPVTLVCVVKKMFNDDEVASIVKHALRYSNVRGVTFQPIRASGRHASFDKDLHSTTLSEVRRTLLVDLGLPEDAIVPHPRNPENMCIGYFARGDHGGDLVDMTKKVFAIDHPNRRRIDELLYFLPDLDYQDLTYEKLFRIAVVSFLDKNSFTINQARRSGIVFLTDEGLTVPIDVYYLFGAKGQRASIPLPIAIYPQTKK